MNLEILNIEEISFEEQKSIEGGNILRAVGSFAIWVFDNWGDIKAGYDAA